MTTINWSQYFILSVDVYLKDTTEIDQRLTTCGFDFKKKTVNEHNGRTNYQIETSPAHMEKISEILNN